MRIQALCNLVQPEATIQLVNAIYGPPQLYGRTQDAMRMASTTERRSATLSKSGKGALRRSRTRRQPVINLSNRVSQERWSFGEGAYPGVSFAATGTFSFFFPMTTNVAKVS
jgi:hypothetical protein